MLSGQDIVPTCRPEGLYPPGHHIWLRTGYSPDEFAGTSDLCGPDNVGCSCSDDGQLQCNRAVNQMLWLYFWSDCKMKCSCPNSPPSTHDPEIDSLENCDLGSSHVGSWGSDQSSCTGFGRFDDLDNDPTSGADFIPAFRPSSFPRCVAQRCSRHSDCSKPGSPSGCLCRAGGHRLFGDAYVAYCGGLGRSLSVNPVSAGGSGSGGGAAGAGAGLRGSSTQMVNGNAFAGSLLGGADGALRKREAHADPQTTDRPPSSSSPLSNVDGVNTLTNASSIVADGFSLPSNTTSNDTVPVSLPGHTVGCACNCTYISVACCEHSAVDAGGIVYESPSKRLGRVAPGRGKCCNDTTGNLQTGIAANGVMCL
ncbi:MAG: hypothetical protein M1817_005752 [Caeruleum heppii]|nr:MAG: hypothetical protein M1817_005752 [Caeruleum heppii]